MEYIILIYRCMCSKFVYLIRFTYEILMACTYYLWVTAIFKKVHRIKHGVVVCQHVFVYFDKSHYSQGNFFCASFLYTQASTIDCFKLVFSIGHDRPFMIMISQISMLQLNRHLCVPSFNILHTYMLSAVKDGMTKMFKFFPVS